MPFNEPITIHYTLPSLRELEAEFGGSATCASLPKEEHVPKTATVRWVSSLKKIEARMWAEAQKVADQYRREVLIPFCRKHELTFVSGMGSYCFHQIHIPEDDYSHYPGQVGDVEDAERKGYKMKQIFAVLDHEITRAQYLGYLVADITEKDLHGNKGRKT